MDIRGMGLALLVLLGTGCGADEIVACNGQFNIAPGFNPNQYAAIKSAADRWNKFAGRDVINLSVGVGIDHVCTIRPGDPNPRREPNVFGRTYLLRYEIVLDAQHLNWVQLEQVTAHEFGHALGLSHVSDPDATMNRLASSEFTDADLAECRRVGVCD